MVFNIDNLVLTLNGHVVQGGYSDDADAVMFEPIELVGDPRRGADGSMAYFSTGAKGTEFILKFLPNAPSIPFFQQQAAIVQRGGSVLWDGSVRDTQRKVSIQLRRGVMRTYQPFPNYGAGAVSNHEYVFTFEEVIPDFDAAAAGAFASVAA